MPPVSGDLRLMFIKGFREWKRPLVQTIRLAASRLGPHGGLGWKLSNSSRRRPYRWSGLWLRSTELRMGRSLDSPLESVTAGGGDHCWSLVAGGHMVTATTVGRE